MGLGKYLGQGVSPRMAKPAQLSQEKQQALPTAYAQGKAQEASWSKGWVLQAEGPNGVAQEATPFLNDMKLFRAVRKTAECNKLNNRAMKEA